MVTRRKFLHSSALLGLAASFAPLTSRAAKAGSAITVAESEGHGWAVVYVADAADHWSNNGLEVEVAKFTAGRLALDAVLTESADFCTTTQSPTLLAAMRGLNPRIVADFSRSSREMLVTANRKKGVAKATDLKGKKVATKMGTSGHFFLNQFLALHGMTLKDVEVVNMGGPEMVTAVVKGDIDAFAWDWLSVIAAQKQAGDDIVVLDHAGIENIWGYHLILVANDKVVQERPDVVEMAVKSLVDAEAFIADNPEKTIGYVAKRTATSLEDTEKGIGLLDIGVKLDNSLVDVMVAETEWAIAQNIAQPYDGDVRVLFRDVIYQDALAKVAPDRVSLS